MTNSAVVLRTLVDDIIPRPSKIRIEPYVLHDPSVRDNVMSGSNLVVRERKSFFIKPPGRLLSPIELVRKKTDPDLE